MARKASDLFSLLAARGGNRRSGILSQVAKSVGAAFSSKKQPGPRRVVLSGISFLGVCFVCVALGYLLGDQFPVSPGRQALRANSDGRGDDAAAVVFGEPFQG